MSKLICGAMLAFASMATHAAMPQMSEIDWDVLHTISRLSPAKHQALLYVANECRMVPNRELVSALLSTPLVAEVMAALPSGRPPAVPASFCAMLGS
ncbi:MAG TPA: hypothetical protein VHQ87_06790, partial [Rhizobacter sp.]|nr:hypothetical protein [Rhizobacter sp.]